MILDNLTIGAIVWGVITVGIILTIAARDCRIKKMFGKSCKK